MCRVLGVSCRGYYAWCNRDGQYFKAKELRLVEISKRIHHNSRLSYGSPRVHAQLKARGISCSLKRTEKLMRKFGIRSKLKRKFKVTTNSKHSRPVADNVIARDFKAEQHQMVLRYYLYLDGRRLVVLVSNDGFIFA